MKKSLITAAAILSFVYAVSAQTLYMPRNVKNAYTAGTRSADGRPGPKYWQNKGVYKIALTVNPPERTIKGSEEIIYTNNSPTPLEQLVFRLELNSHQPESPRERPVSAEYLTTGVHIDEYTENGKAKAWRNTKGLTFDQMALDTPLAPGSSVKLTFKWHVDLADHSGGNGREGIIDPTTYFIAYWYPRVAVYDDTDGWDTGFFTEGHEFYNDFNDYTFDVTAPKNFVVWATGDLLNPDEVLQPEFAGRLKRSFTADDTVHIATLAELTAKAVTRQSDTLTWKWKATNVSDVALSLSDHFIWDAGSVVVDKAKNRRASVQAAYDVQSKDFEKMVEYGKHALDWCSNNFPGTPYPFQKTTIVRGFADMEYPMMVNDSSQQDPALTRLIVEHEILHSWFPFYMGINERRYGFMDEGWTTAFEYMIGTADMGKQKSDEEFRNFRVGGWIGAPAADADLPIIMPGDAMTGQGFGNSEYGKAALGYIAIKDILGDTEFKRVLRQFIADWNGKHPLPWDMFNSFNRTSGKNLNWFYDNWFFSNGYIDLKIAEVTPNATSAKVTIENIGGFCAPFDIVVMYADGTFATFHQTPSVWAGNQKTAVVEVPITKKVSGIGIDGGIFMDADPSNNRWEVK